MKKISAIILSSSIVMGCTDQDSPFFWEPLAEINHQMNKPEISTAPYQPTETAPSDIPTETQDDAIVETEINVQTPEPVEVVQVKEVEPTKQDIAEVKKIDTGTSVCMLNDILTNDFEVIDPGTKGEIVQKSGKTYFVAGGREFDITNVPAPTKPC